MAATRSTTVLRNRPTRRITSTNVPLMAAYGVAFLSAIRFRLPLDIQIGAALALLLLPVTYASLLRYRGAFSIASMSAVAALTGVLVTAFADGFADTDARLLASNVAQVLGIGVLLAALLWARDVMGSRPLVLTYGLGMLSSTVVQGVNFGNSWKFTFSVPITLILLSLPWVYLHRWPQVVAIGALSAVSMLNDSRSLTGMLLIALVLTLTQGVERKFVGTSRVALVLVRVVLVSAAGYFFVQAAILDGFLGEGAQARTEAQIDISGSVITGGRPEIGAASSLLSSRPWGFGAGTLPSGTDVLTAKTGMRALGYDPDNGYVNNYMFGNGFEVHSVVGDLWLRFGVGGLILAIVVAVSMIAGLSRALAAGAASTVMVFLVLRTLWDLPFSPIGSALLTLPIAIAIALPAKASGGQQQPREVRDRLNSRSPLF